MRLGSTTLTHSLLISLMVGLMLDFSSRIIEATRFDKEFAVADKKVREEAFDIKMGKLNTLRMERLRREHNRWDSMDRLDQFDKTRI